jgi:heptosyltransferase-2
VIVISEAGKLNEDVIGELFNRDIELVETKNIYELMNIIKKCAVFISNDSGPLYIANMLGIPTFTVYGPTNPQFSLPYGKNHSFIQRKLRCSPEANAQYCFTNAGRNGCPSNECMHLLDFEEVFTALTEFLVSLGIYQKDSAQSA